MARRPIAATHGMNVHTVMMPTQYDAIDPSSAASERRKGADGGELTMERDGKI